jgi:membrane protease YdiL (CAAX protease family)
MNELNNFILHITCYTLLFIITWYAKHKRSLKLLDFEGWPHSFYLILVFQFSGIILFGIIPILFLGWNTALRLTTSTLQSTTPQIFLTFTLAIIAGSIAFIQSKTIIIYNYNQEKRTEKPHLQHFHLYLFLRVFYLLAYEFWFRGFFFFDSINVWGLTLAIIINTFFYVLIHYFSGQKEMLACVPFGIIMCLLCWWTNTVWPAMIIHVTIAMAYEINIIYQFSKNNDLSNEVSARRN